MVWLGIVLGVLAPLALILITVRTLLARRRLLRGLAGAACRACGNAFSDAVALPRGGLTSADRERLDHFQRRFARCRVECGDCGAINLVTADGIPCLAFYPRDD